MIEGIVGTIFAIVLIALWLSKLKSVPVSTWALGLTKQQRAYVRAKARERGLEPEAIYDAWARKRLAKGLYSGEFIQRTLERERAERDADEAKPSLEGYPPDDVEALVFGISIKVSRVGGVDQEGKINVVFDSHCEDCGGYVITLSEPVTDESAATCKACGRLFGRWVAVRALMRDVYRDHQKRGVGMPENGASSH